MASSNLLFGAVAALLLCAPALAQTDGGAEVPPVSFDAVPVTTLAGEQVPLSRLAGKVTVVSVWGSFCGPCRAETPWLEALASSYREDKSVVFLSATVDPCDSAEDRAAIRRTAAEWRIGIPVVCASDALTDLLPKARLPDGKTASIAVPSLMVADAHGHRYTQMGLAARSEEAFVRPLQQLIDAARSDRLGKLVEARSLWTRADGELDQSPQKALQSYQAAYELGLTEQGLSYSAACAAARAHQLTTAFHWLERALDAGFDDAAWLAKDEDLASLRPDPRFAAALRRARKNAKAPAASPKKQ